MRKLRIGICARQIELNPSTCIDLRRELKFLLTSLKGIVVGTSPTDAMCRKSLSRLFVESATNYRIRKFEDDRNYKDLGNGAPVRTDDLEMAALTVNSYAKTALKHVSLALMAVEALESNRSSTGTPYIAQQLECLREIRATTDQPTLDAAMSLLKHSVDNSTQQVIEANRLVAQVLKSIPETFDRLDKLTLDPKFS